MKGSPSENADVSLTGRSLLTVQELSAAELQYLLNLSAQLKRERQHGVRGNRLERSNIALLFEKVSTRTRAAFTVAAEDEGANVTFMRATDMHLGKKESIADTARVLGRMYDGILFRGYLHETAELLAKYAGVPVWNGLSDREHPTQTVADLFTVQECFGELRDLKIVYVGDGRNNVANSLMLGAAKVGVHFVNCTPKELSPDLELVEAASRLARDTGGSVRIEREPKAAVEGANAVYTDVWVSMGEEAVFQERVDLLRPYQVTMELMRGTGHLEEGKVIFLHCLPAFHDKYTEITKEIGALEVTDDVFEAPFSRVFDQAENRMHTAKALMVATLL